MLDRMLLSWRAPRAYLCSFGIVEGAIAAGILADASIAGAATGIAGSLGADAALATTIGGLAAGGIEGAAGGALFGAITGGDPGMGALLGGAGGGIAGGFGAAGGGVADVSSGVAGAAGDASGALSTPAAGSLGAAAAPAGPSATGAGSLGDVVGAGGNSFTLPGTLGGNPDLSAGIGTGATSGNTGLLPGGSFSAQATGGLAPAEAGPTGFPPGGGSASSGELGGGVPDAGLGGFISPGPDATVAATPLGSPSTPSFTGPQPTATGPFGQPVATPGASAAPGGGGAGAETSVDRLVKDPTLGNAARAAGNNANLLLPAGVLAAQALTQPSLPDPTTISKGQQDTAGNLTSQGQSLLNSLNTGQIPAGAQGALDQATNSAIARIRSQYAGMGLSGSTMETQAINQVQQQAEAQKFSIIQSLVTTGLNETQLGNSIYNSLLQSTLSQDKALSDSISRFAAASAGGRPLVVAGG